jgi:hypothetical protein
MSADIASQLSTGVWSASLLAFAGAGCLLAWVLFAIKLLRPRRGASGSNLLHFLLAPALFILSAWGVVLILAKLVAIAPTLGATEVVAFICALALSSAALRLPPTR